MGKFPKKIRISNEEMGFAYRHRQLTGEPIQTFVRRLIREAYVNELEADQPEGDDGRSALPFPVTYGRDRTT